MRRPHHLQRQGELMFKVGTRVRRIATSEEGVVIRLQGELLEVAFASGTVLVAFEEVGLAPQDPAELLAAGVLGRAEPYALRLQALYLRHAYRYDPLTGLSNAR